MGHYLNELERAKENLNQIKGKEIVNINVTGYGGISFYAYGIDITYSDGLEVKERIGDYKLKRDGIIKRANSMQKVIKYFNTEEGKKYVENLLLKEKNNIYNDTMNSYILVCSRASSQEVKENLIEIIRRMKEEGDK